MANYAFSGTPQFVTIGAGGSYVITAYGAAGGGSSRGNASGGYGAEILGSFTLTPGEKLEIVVGGAGKNNSGSYGGGGGGGGTFVLGNGTGDGTGNGSYTPLLVAGGGAYIGGGKSASLGGGNGNGGNGGSGSNNGGGGGAGVKSNGSNGVVITVLHWLARVVPMVPAAIRGEPGQVVTADLVVEVVTAGLVEEAGAPMQGAAVVVEVTRAVQAPRTVLALVGGMVAARSPQTYQSRSNQPRSRTRRIRGMALLP